MLAVGSALGAGAAAAGDDVSPCGWRTGFHAAGLSHPAAASAVFDDGSGPKLYIGGRFDVANDVRADHVVAWDGASYSALGAGVDGPVNALAVFDDGTGPALYAAGEFERAGGVLTPGLARWDGSTWSAVGAGLGRPPGFPWAYALTVYDDGDGDALYVAGWFSTAGGAPASNIARWDGAAFEAVGAGVDGPVQALEVFDGGSGAELYAGGTFAAAGGAPASKIARWDGSAWSTLGLGPDAGVNGGVRALAVYDAGAGPELYLGGTFDRAGGLIAARIARWDGSAFSAAGAGFAASEETVFALHVHDDGSGSALYAGGLFFNGGGAVGADLVARWDGAAWSSVGSGSDLQRVPAVSTLATFDDGSGAALFAAGDRLPPNVFNRRFARWDGSEWTSPDAAGFGLGVDGAVMAFEAFDDGDGERLQVGGDFFMAGAEPHTRAAIWDGAGWTCLGTGLNCSQSELLGAVQAFAALDGGSGPELYAAGSDVRRWNGAFWTPIAFPFGLQGEIEDLVVFDDGSGPALYAGGSFSGGVRRWTGSAWAFIGGGLSADAQVLALAVHDDGSGPALYVGGTFSKAGGAPVSNLAKWDGVAWSAVGSLDADIIWDFQPWNDGGGEVLFAAGSAEIGLDQSGLARWDGTSWSLILDDTNSPVSVGALGIYDDGERSRLALAAGFNPFPGTPEKTVSTWNGSAFTKLGTIEGRVRTLRTFDDGQGPALFVGGDFTELGGVPSQNVGVYFCPPQPPLFADGFESGDLGAWSFSTP